VVDRERSPQSAIDELLDEMALGGHPVNAEAEVRNAALGQLNGFGVLQTYLDDPSIEEIWVNRPNQIFVARGSEVNVLEVELGEETLRTIVLRMLRNSGRRVDTSMPFVDAALPDRSRLHVVIPDVTSQHWSVNIRKFPARIISLTDLVSFGSLTQTQANFLSQQVRAGSNILISGATQAGKTTLLCALLNELSQDTRLITCEETFEIRTRLEDWVPMQTRQPNLEGRGEIPLRRLVKEALRMRPGYLVIGEVREAEALDLLIGMNSGIPGACTIHANSAQAALIKLCTLPLLAGPNISGEFVRQTAAQAINLVVQCSNLSPEGRRVSQICRVELDQAGNPHAVEVQL
jgi:pilus assembly protein CpaF